MLSASASIAQLYIAYFNRAPEPVGFDFWLDVLDNPVTLREIATLFSTQPETTEIYPFLADRDAESVEAFLTTVYQNLFDRDPDAEGLAFWSGVIQAGADLGTILLEIINGASEADRAVLDAKIGVAEYWVDAARDADGYSLTDEAIDVSREAIEAANTPSPSQQTGTEITDLYFQDAARVELDPLDVALSPGATFISSVKVADITVVDDALGSNTLGLQGDDADNFEIMDNALFLKQGSALNFGPDGELNVVVTVDDTARGWNLTQGPEAGTGLTLTRENIEVEGAGDVMLDPFGGEFLGNDITRFRQRQPDIAALDENSYVVTWQSSDSLGPDFSGDAIQARVLRGNGDELVPEFTVNSLYTGPQAIPSVATLANGDFVITWQSNDNNLIITETNNTDIRAAIFEADGDVVTSDFLVNDLDDDSQQRPDVAALAGGGFVITWHSAGVSGDGNGFGVKARLFDADGDAEGPEFLVNEGTFASQTQAKAVGLPDGGFVITWASGDNSEDGSGSAIMARIFDEDGDDVSGEFLVNQVGFGNQFFPDITVLADGNILFVWSSFDPDVDNEIRGRIFDPLGEDVTDEFPINALEEGNQTIPAITALPDGGFVAAWESTDGDEDQNGSEVWSRAFDAMGDPLTGDVQVNNLTDGDEDSVAVTTLDNGQIVFAWMSSDPKQGDNSLQGIKLRRFDLEADETSSTTDAITVALNPEADFAYNPAEMVGVPAEPDDGIV